MKLRLLVACLSLTAVGLAGPVFALLNDHGVNIVNETDAPIQAIHFSSCKDDKWGPDRLGADEIILPKAAHFFDMHDGIADCCRDVLARFANGAQKQRKALNVCQVYEWIVR
jgi:hypothetical protein